tara:strand:- start:9913 stop:11049 length:1137 start_codon:yes stop_codon:yes gene_type:complete
MKFYLSLFFAIFSLINIELYSQNKTFKLQQIDDDLIEGKVRKSDNLNLNKSIVNQSFINKINTENLDKVQFPVFYEFELNLNDLYNLDLNKDYFFSKLYMGVYSDYDSITIDKNNNLFSTLPDDNFRLKYQLGDESYFSGWIYQGYLNDTLYNKYSYASEVENNFIHVWDLSEYPFDKQQLKIQFIASKDTSLVRLRSSDNLPSTFNESISDLKKGYSINQITSDESFYVSPFDFTDKENVFRKKVFSVLSFYIEVDRSGSWLFIKLFIGSFLSFFISVIVFLIPLKEFESRISLSVGGIFGAIGNRYFVDSTMQNVQVLTKADIINNMILLLLVFNILVVTLQHTKKYNIPFLENNDNAIKISVISFIALLSIILIV